MRPTFLGFETARKGMMVNQKGIDITGQNMVNINTAGYTRQRIDQVSMTTSGIANRFASSTVGLSGQGVRISGVGQIRDSYLDNRFREEIANTSYFDTAQTMIDGIESALDEVSSAGLNAVFAEFISSLQDFSKKPIEVTSTNLVMSSAKNITQMLRQFDNQLNQLATTNQFELSTDVNSVNSMLEKIASLNKHISDEQIHNQTGNMTYGVNELLDQRNLLLDDLSAFGNIKVTDEADGTVTVRMNEQVIVSKDKFDKLALDKNQNDHTTSLTWESTGKSAILGSGSLKASIELINGIGGETKGVQYYKNQLDLFAGRFAHQMNTAFKESVNPDKYMQLIGNDSTYIIDASNISLNSKWLENSGMIIKDAQKEGSLDQSNILKLINDLSGKQTIGSFEGSLSDFIDFYNTTIGQDKTYYKSRFDASLAVANDLNNRRDNISGVMMDEEGANLMMYEKAYQASARLMTVLDEALDVLINRTGLVGR